MAQWWAEIVEVPCIVLGGRDVETLGDAAETGAEFIALSAAVFKDLGAAASRVERANTVIDAVSATILESLAV